MHEFKPCPKCAAEGAKRVPFAWWGGIMGPLILTHVKCPQCRTKYNGRTGRSNAKAIAIYFTVAWLIILSLIGITVFAVYWYQQQMATVTCLPPVATNCFV